jgi:hypothetical protein
MVESGIDKDFNQRLLTTYKAQRGNRKKFFASRNIQITYLNGASYVFLGIDSHRLGELTYKNILSFVVMFQQLA